MQDGEWFPWSSDVMFRIRPSNSPVVKQDLRSRLAKLTTDEKNQYRRYAKRVRKSLGEVPDDELATRLAVSVMADSTVCDWLGITSGGEPAPYNSAEMFEAMMQNETLRDWVSEKADALSQVIGEYQADSEGNSEGTESGTAG